MSEKIIITLAIELYNVTTDAWCKADGRKREKDRTWNNLHPAIKSAWCELARHVQRRIQNETKP